MTVVQAAVEGRKSVTGNHPVRALLRMDEAWQAEDWRRRYLSRIPEWIVDTISENEVTARLLVDHLVERGVDHVLLAGQSDLTFAVVAELAQRGREGDLDADRRAVDPRRHRGRPVPRTTSLEEHELSQRRFGNSRLDRVARRDRTVSSTRWWPTRSRSTPRPRWCSAATSASPTSGSRPGSARPTRGCSSTPATPRSPAWAPSRCWRRSARSAPRWTPARAGRSTAGSGSRGWCTRTTSAPTPTPTTRPGGRGPSSRRSTASPTSARCSPCSAPRSPSAAAGARAPTAASPPSDDQLDEMARREHESWLEHHQQHTAGPGARAGTGSPRSTPTCCRGTSSPTRAAPRPARA